MLDNAIAQMRQWFSQPFNTSMSASGWFFFFGLLIVISVLWSLILRHIREAGEYVTG